MPWEEARPAAEAAWERVARGEAVRIPVSEEQVHVGKREVEAGGVHVRKVVKTEHVNQPVELRREEIEIVREGKGQGEPAPAGSFQEGEAYVPLKAEEPVVEKTARKVGEVAVSKQSEAEHEEVGEEVRREEVEVEHEEHAHH